MRSPDLLAPAIPSLLLLAQVVRMPRSIHPPMFREAGTPNTRMLVGATVRPLLP